MKLIYFSVLYVKFLPREGLRCRCTRNVSRIVMWMRRARGDRPAERPPGMALNWMNLYQDELSAFDLSQHIC
jgi:hypothetical protein